MVHDFDYEKFPNETHSATEEHPAEGVRILRSKGFPEDSITKLERKTQEIENRIAAAIDSERAAYFAKARIFAAESSKVQTDFVEAVLREIPKRYYDPGPAIQEMLHRHKLEFLTTIARELGV